MPITIAGINMVTEIKPQEARVDFSFKREVFFIIAGGIIGAMVMAIPFTFFSAEGISRAYDITWVVFGHIVGVHSPISSAIIAGMTIHIIVGISIGIVSGVFLYKTNLLNISKPSNGLRYGLFVGIFVYLIFSIPVSRFVLNPEFRHVLVGNNNNNNYDENRNNGKNNDNDNNSNNIVTFSNFQIASILYPISINLLFGITLGLSSSFLSIKFGARYRCPSCDISFSRIDILQNHLLFVHADDYDKHQTTNRKRIVILGGGFGGVTVLKKLQNHFQTDVSIDITMVSKDNYLLFTPMLHEIASGMIETRHIVTPIREFCNRSRFYCATVKNIDLEKKRVSIRSSTSSTSAMAKIIGGSSSLSTIDTNILESKTQPYLYYDYLVIALGSETKFFGMLDIQQNAFTIKTLNDAINLRNHTIYLLEQSDQLILSAVGTADVENIYGNIDNSNIKTFDELQKKILTFVIVGGGFAGVETAGEINDFIRDSVKEHYHNIDINNIRVIIVHSGDRLLPEMSKQLAEFASERLRKSGIEIILNQRVTGATPNTVRLKDGTIIPTKTIIWSGGVAPSSLLTSISCEHDDKSGRITVDKYLELPNYKGVYALGDCAYVTDPNSGNPYPPTAQHAIREGAIVANNLIASIEGRLEDRKIFDYKTKGMMASIGKRTGIGDLLGIEVQGLLAWLIWRSYYLVHLPTVQKKIRVLADWILDMFFKRDVTMLKTLIEEEEKAGREEHGSLPSSS
ncbi:MAG: NAD(P)/FAD-dependent oxidoreductase [Nitrososphaeraceae archaeon]|nr:NAD(P)/FAD-dependent oxidoreductase [Nitrososphaeraceae archaeon]